MDTTANARDTVVRKQFSILFVEDGALVRFLIAKRLTRKYPEMRIDLAENGAIGLEMFTRAHHDLVITDNRMPVMTGIEMATKMKLLRPETIIVFLTAGLDSHSLQLFQENDMEHYLVKPIILRELFRIIDGYIEG
ncbi:MAG: response regulator [Deltaproteobacteria bacterium]|nr:response regulator [Deltaproteobacteria bacterium]